MRHLFNGFALACLLSLNGCVDTHYPRGEIGFWQQHVQVTTWGLYYIGPYGPIGLGYLQWSRNQEPNPAQPPIVTVP